MGIHIHEHTSTYIHVAVLLQLLAGNTSAVANLRRKYAQLLAVALTLQNLLDDVATQLERLHSCITWQDPSATLLFIGFCLSAALGLAVLGLPVIMAFVLFWMVSAEPTAQYLVVIPHARLGCNCSCPTPLFSPALSPFF